ncbi:MAG: hypothetical protein IPP88_13795 [Betaproteobacteria bacterium]|nr:hypothetical protein [Betaproteobacteria bacterium]
MDRYPITGNFSSNKKHDAKKANTQSSILISQVENLAVLAVPVYVVDQRFYHLTVIPLCTFDSLENGVYFPGSGAGLPTRSSAAAGSAIKPTSIE